MSDPDDSKSASAAQPTIAGPGPIRDLKHGSQTEIAQWLLGSDPSFEGKPDYGALRGAVYSGGALWLCSPDCVWRRRDSVYGLVKAFDGAQYMNPEGKLRALQSSAELGRRVMRTIEDEAHRENFFDGKDSPIGLAFRNGFLRVAPDGGCRLEELTPECRARRMLPFDYDPTPAPQAYAGWKAFLASVWGSGGGEDGQGPDVEAITLLHQIIGYLLSGSNEHQKAFLFLGPPRSGKGTIAKLLARLLGTDCKAFKFAGLDGNFALEGLLDASVAIDSDVRRSKSANRDEGKIVERLLGITSGDLQEVPRKNKTALSIVLSTRLVLISNPPFSIRDVGSAASSRVVVLPFRNSFLGIEDTGLEARLAAELPAIVALAMQSMRGLRAAGRFCEPASAAELREETERGQTPLREFFEEWCELDASAVVSCGALYAAMRQWAEAGGNSAPSAQSFASALKQLGVQRRRRQLSGVRCAPEYVGVRLLPEAAPAAAGATAGATIHHLPRRVSAPQ